MKPIFKLLKVNKHEYYIKHFSIINPLLPQDSRLTDKEIEVLAKFMSLEGHIAKERFGSIAKKFVKEELGLSPQGMHNYMKSLKAKGFIQNNDLVEVLKPAEPEQIYNFKLVLA